MLSPQHADRSEPNESISQVITHNMALPLSYYLGTEVPLPDIDGSGLGGGGAVYSGIHGASEGTGDGTERSGRPCSFVGDGTAEGIGIELCRDGEGTTAIRVFTKFRELKRRPYWAIGSGPGDIVSIRWVWTRVRFARMCGIRRGGNAKPSNGVGISDLDESKPGTTTLAPSGGKADSSPFRG